MYLIRYGLMGHIGRFRASVDSGGAFERGQAVVIESDRGVELGEVLIACDDGGPADSIAETDPAAASDSVESGAAIEPSLCRAAVSQDFAQAAGECVKAESFLDVPASP